MLTEKPASWHGLQKAIEAVNGETVKEAIVIQLEYQQPSADVYNFLERTLDLVMKSGRYAPKCSGEDKDDIMVLSCGAKMSRSATTGHGVDCDCEDSCLEYICDKCGYTWSSNRHPENWECMDSSCDGRVRVF